VVYGQLAHVPFTRLRVVLRCGEDMPLGVVQHLNKFHFIALYKILTPPSGAGVLKRFNETIKASKPFHFADLLDYREGVFGLRLIDDVIYGGFFHGPFTSLRVATG
jgi:hypothetical protein